MKRFSLSIIAAVSLLAASLTPGTALATPAGAPTATHRAVPSHVGVSAGASASKRLVTCPTGGPTGACYWYGVGRQNSISPAVTSIAAGVTIDDPWISSVTYAYHTLMEIALQDANGNILEWGWTRDNTGVYADNHPRLFAAYWTTAGGFAGYNAGFVDYSANPINTGADLTSVINTEKVFAIQYAAATGPSNPARWWFYYDGSPVGSIPASLLPTFTGATTVQVFGEVASTDDHPCTDMGGNPATLPTSTTYSARFNSVTYNGSGTGVNLTAGSGADPAAPQPTWYNGVLKSGSTRTVNVGGPSGC